MTGARRRVEALHFQFTLSLEGLRHKVGVEAWGEAAKRMC